MINLYIYWTTYLTKVRNRKIDTNLSVAIYQSSAIRFVDTLPHFLIRVYSWKCGVDGCYMINLYIYRTTYLTKVRNRKIDTNLSVAIYQSSAIRFVDTLPHFLIRVYSWKCGADGCYRQMWQVSCRRQGMLTQGPAPDPKSKV